MNQCDEPRALALKPIQLKRRAHCRSISIAFLLIDGITGDILMFREKNWLSYKIFLL
jgi:hypothetical protein